MKRQNNKVAHYTVLSAHPLSNIDLLGLFFTNSIIIKKID